MYFAAEKDKVRRNRERVMESSLDGAAFVDTDLVCQTVGPALATAWTVIMEGLLDMDMDEKEKEHPSLS